MQAMTSIKKEKNMDREKDRKREREYDTCNISTTGQF